MVKGSDILRGAARAIPAAALKPFGRPVALFFHGVVERLADPRIEINHHTLASFREIANQLRREFDVLPLAEIDDALARPEKHRRTVFLMSDDGYANTLLAADVLAQSALPWTLFASTGHIDTDELNPLTTARLFIHFAPKGSYRVPHLDTPLTLDADGARGDAELRVIPALKHLAEPEARETVAAMRAAFPDDHFAELRARFSSEHYLDWAGLKALRAQGVEIGAHAHWHWPMNAFQSNDALREQAQRPRALIERHLGACRFFAYPFGNIGDVSADARNAVREAGYTHAFTTLSGTLGPGLDPFLLPRYGLAANEPSLGSLLPMMRAANRRLVGWQERLI